MKDAQKFLRTTDQQVAIKELMRQCQRLILLYGHNQKRRARYWSPIDASALFAVASNKQLDDQAADRAAEDLENCEKMTQKLTGVETEVYNNLIYFLEVIVKPVKTKEELFANISKFVKLYGYKHTHIGIIVRFIKLGCKLDDINGGELTTVSPRMVQSLRDAIQRVRSNANTNIKDKFMNRIELVIEYLQTLSGGKEESESQDKVEPESPESSKSIRSETETKTSSLESPVTIKA